MTRADRFTTHRADDYAPYKAQMDANAQDPAKIRRTIKALEALGPSYAGEVNKLRDQLQKLTGQRQ